jgi:polysaccharide biosynthesis protein PslH
VAALWHRERGEEDATEELTRACEVAEPVERAAPPSGLRERLAPRLALLRGVPIWASEIAEPRFESRVAALAAEWRPDVVQIEYPVTAQYLPALSGSRAPRVLVDHDASVRTLRRWPGMLGGLTRVLDERAWRRFRRRALERVDAGVVFTERDRSALEALRTGTPVELIPVAADVPQAPSSPVGTGSANVLFVGNFAHPPNVDAARWLAAELFPSLLRMHPDATLAIVGPSPPPELSALRSERIVIPGEVPDLAPYLDAAAVVAAPIRTGGGMRVKVIEALAAGKAVVATPLAVDGLGASPGEHVEVAATAEQFVASLARLLGSAEERLALAERARDWALEHAGWAQSVARYEALYDRLIAERAAGTR